VLVRLGVVLLLFAAELCTVAARGRGRAGWNADDDTVIAADRSRQSDGGRGLGFANRLNDLFLQQHDLADIVERRRIFALILVALGTGRIAQSGPTGRVEAKRNVARSSDAEHRVEESHLGPDDRRILGRRARHRKDEQRPRWNEILGLRH
jgi:hypothetical protein